MTQFYTSSNILHISFSVLVSVEGTIGLLNNDSLDSGKAHHALGITQSYEDSCAVIHFLQIEIVNKNQGTRVK